MDHPIPQHQQFESQFKRFKFDEELFTRMGINLQHFSTEGPPQFTLPSMDPLNFMSANLTNAAMDFQCKQGFFFGKKLIKFIVVAKRK